MTPPGAKIRWNWRAAQTQLNIYNAPSSVDIPKQTQMSKLYYSKTAIYYLFDEGMQSCKIIQKVFHPGNEIVKRCAYHIANSQCA